MPPAAGVVLQRACFCGRRMTDHQLDKAFAHHLEGTPAAGGMDANPHLRLLLIRGQQRIEQA